MKKKYIFVLLVSLAILSSPLSFSYAKNELVEGRALSMAHQYIENSLSDEAWAGNNPVISAQNKFYTDDAKKVSYIEYKVTCDSSPDCGFIMMNVDGNDVSVPIASPTGNTPSEILDQGKDVSEKLYYFGPFDLYSENEVTGDVQALDPQVAVDLRDDTQVKRSSEEARLVKEQREALKIKLKDAKLAAKEFKKSEEFKKQKEEIKDQILNVPKEEFSMKMLNMANAAIWDSSSTYNSPGLSNIFIAGGTFTTGCNGKTPCYEQFTHTYGTKSCLVGCAPTAMGIIFGWYDRNGFPNLLPGTASRVNDTDVNNMIKTLGGHMLTFCNNGNGSTDINNISNGIQFAKNKGYTNATSYINSSLTPSGIYNLTKGEVDAGRPLIINSQTHSMIGFGYKSTGTVKVIRMNMGWGGMDGGISNSTGVTYYTSNIDQNINSIYFGDGYSYQYGSSAVIVKMN